jgi:hypothetical protein
MQPPKPSTRKEYLVIRCDLEPEASTLMKTYAGDVGDEQIDAVTAVSLYSGVIGMFSDGKVSSSICSPRTLAQYA